MGDLHEALALVVAIGWRAGARRRRHAPVQLEQLVVAANDRALRDALPLPGGDRLLRHDGGSARQADRRRQGLRRDRAVELRDSAAGQARPRATAGQGPPAQPRQYRPGVRRHAAGPGQQVLSALRLHGDAGRLQREQGARARHRPVLVVGGVRPARADQGQGARHRARRPARGDRRGAALQRVLRQLDAARRARQGGGHHQGRQALLGGVQQPELHQGADGGQHLARARLLERRLPGACRRPRRKACLHDRLHVCSAKATA